MIKKLFVLLIIISSSLFSNSKSSSVVCIHGFIGGKWCMHFIGKNLKKDNWNVVNWKYSSRDCLIETHGKRLVKEINSIATKNPEKPINFVAHSMGSLVLLSALNDPNCPEEAKIGKIVLIAPPLKGSSWGRWLNKFSFMRWVTKDFSGKELMTKKSFEYLGKYPDKLEGILVVAGSLSFNPLLSGPNDGIVMVDETLLSSPHKRVVVKRGHKTIVFSKKVSGIVRSFLKSG
jgi:predicted alpha/beta hydrolase family esterase